MTTPLPWAPIHVAAARPMAHLADALGYAVRPELLDEPVRHAYSEPDDESPTLATITGLLDDALALLDGIVDTLPEVRRAAPEDTRDDYLDAETYAAAAWAQATRCRTAVRDLRR